MRLIQNFDVFVCSSPLFLWQDSNVCVRNHLQNWKEEVILVCSCRNFDRKSFTLKQSVILYERHLKVALQGFNEGTIALKERRQIKKKPLLRLVIVRSNDFRSSHFTVCKTSN